MSSRFQIAMVLAVTAALNPLLCRAAEPPAMGNALAIMILANSDFGTRLELCREMGRRQDPGLSEVIAFLRYGLPPRAVTESESLLAALLAGLLDPAWGQDGVSRRFQANRAELEILLERLPDIQDPLLSAFLVKALLFIGDTMHGPSVLRLAGRYGERMANGSENLDPGGIQCVLAVLSYASELGTGDFLEPCVGISKSSRDGVLIRAARSAASRIASRAESR